ncbi:MAG: hypothetical protein PHY47_12880 [Lachnospiraceae bacterium]|nr:hypothetical protein [Lachnospiraceae bacterium]
MLGFKNKSKNEIIEDKPSEDDVKLSQDLFLKFEVAKVAKSPKVEIWNKCLSAYNSDYFKQFNKPDYKSDEISNFIFSTIETIKPIMTDNDPKILILPKTPDGAENIDKLQNAFDYEWVRGKMGRKLPQAITIALQIGTAVIGMFWDGKDENGLGNVKPTLINPFNLYPDPMATCIEDAEYVIYATYKHVNELKKRYPDKANLLSGGTINYKELVSSGIDTSNVQNQILILECWLRDYTTMAVEEDIDGEKKKVLKQKYPKGRIITCCPELNVILEDKKSPYDDGEFPFKIIKCYDVPFEFWGKSEIEQLLSPQTYINDLMNQIIDNAKITANMPWVIDKNAGIGKGQLTNRPGLIIRKNPGSEVKRLIPPPMPNYVAETVNTLKRDIEVISGIHDVTRGEKPGSISAASAIMALQEAAQARIRLKVKSMEHSLSEIGQSWYSRMKQFWVTNRWVRFEDEEGNYSFSEITKEDFDAEIDFVIVGGSTMPQNKSAMLDLIIRLAQTTAEDGMPMVDRETVLTYTSVADKKKIIKKFNDMSNQRAQSQQQADSQAQQQMLMQMQIQAESEQAQLDNQKQIAMMKEVGRVGSQIMNTQNSDGKSEKSKEKPKSSSIDDLTDEQLNEVIKLILSDPQMLQMIVQAASQQQGGVMQGV